MMTFTVKITCVFLGPKENTDDDFVIVDRPGKYFIIQQLRCGNSGKVMNASLSKIGEITMSDFNGGENQLWYWDGRHQDILRNKKFPDKVLNILATTVCTFLIQNISTFGIC